MKKLITVFFLIFSIITSSAYALQPLPVSQAFSMSVGIINNTTLLFNWSLAPNVYLYKKRFHFKVLSPKGVTVAPIKMPEGLPDASPLLGSFQVYAQQVSLPVTLLNVGKQTVNLEVIYQGCSHEGFCYAPQHHTVLVNFANASLKVDYKAPTPVSRQGKIEQLLQGGNWALIVATFLGLGLLLAFTPCVLPMIPILSSIIVGHGKKVNVWRAFSLSLTYVFAMAITYAAAGIVVSLLGANLQAALQMPWVLAIFALIFVLLAFSLFGFYQLQLPESLRSKLGNLSHKQKGGSFLGVFCMGVVATLIVSPCVTPPLIGALAFIGKTGNLTLGGASLFALGFGMGIPLLVIGTLGGKYLPKAGMWMNAVSVFFGFLLLAVAIYLLSRIIPETVTLMLSGALLVAFGFVMAALWKTPQYKHLKLAKVVIGLLIMLYGLLAVIGGAQGNVSLLKPLASPAIPADKIGQLNFYQVNSIKQAKLAIAKAAKQGKPVLLDFYADWCIACKEMEATTLVNPAVQKTLKHFVLLQVNITHETPSLKALQKQYGIIAPPSFVFFDSQGRQLKGREIVGAMAAPAFLQHLQDVLALK